MPRKDKSSRREYNRAYFKKWREKNKRKHFLYVKAGKLAVKAWFYKLREALACIRCGEDHPACLDFHHRDPATKLFQVGTAWRSRSKAAIEAEILKCDVLCSNCHRKLHDAGRPTG